MRRRAASALLVSLLLCACTGAPRQTELDGRISVGEAMGGGSTAGFARATEVPLFRFPADHGPHEEFRTEWWYFTGNLASDGGDEFGFQWTAFRHALAPQVEKRESLWSSRDVWFAHFGLGDAARREFHGFERFERGALGLAGARAEPFAVWVGDWRAESVAPASTFPMRIVAAEESVTLDVVVDRLKPLVYQGERGLSQKGPEPGNASIYYSATRLEAKGSVTVDGVETPVRGTAWLDREWSTSALSEGQEGWDWFAIQLEDGRELMLYRLRREDGRTDPFNSGVLVAPDGSSRRLGPDEVVYRPGRSWRSPESGASYPVEWELIIAPLEMELTIEPMLDASELDVSVRYWEGAIRVSGSDASGPVAGKGFLEMTGYDDLVAGRAVR